MGRKVLVVEDSQIQRQTIHRIMEALEWRVVEAAHGKQAMEQLLHHDDIELITLDWHMPVMDGLEFLSTCRSMPEFAETPKVMMMSFERTMPAIVRAISAGADEYIIKPFTLEIFTQKLNALGFPCRFPFDEKIHLPDDEAGE